MVEFGLEVPGRYILVDHALARLQRGLAGYLIVDGPAAPEIFDGTPISEDTDCNVLAWDVPGGRRFPYGSSSPNCALISEAKFRELVNQLQGNGHG